jgi:hypothetical protein
MEGTISNMDCGTLFFLPARRPEHARIVPIGENVESTAERVTRGDPIAIEYETGEEDPLVGEALHLERTLRSAKEGDCVATGGVPRGRANPTGKLKSEFVLEVIGWLEPN